MSEIREYSYLKSRERRIVYINAFLSALITAWIFRATVAVYASVFAYQNTFDIVMLGALAAHGLGFVCGRFLFRTVPLTRAVFIPLEILFAALAGFLVLAPRLSGCITDLVAIGVAGKPLLSLGLLALLPFLMGLKTNYFLKVSIGRFFDEKRGGPKFIAFLFSGLVAGAGLWVGGIGEIPVLAAVAVILTSGMLISLRYSPDPILAKGFGAAPAPEENAGIYRDDLLFTYLNFSYITVYLYLGMLVAQKFLAPSDEIRFLFLFVSLGSIVFGFLLAPLARRISLHIYNEMTYPFFFVGYYLFMFTRAGTLGHSALLSYVPLGILFGFSAYHSVKCMQERFPQATAHSVLGLSFYLIPLPVIAALYFVPFTDRWFFVFVYIMAIFNLILPGVHLSQEKVPEYRKGLFYVLLMLSLPVFIVAHSYFRVPLSGDLFIRHLGGIDGVANINSGADHEIDEATITINDTPVMHISGHGIRNLRRSVLAASVFAGVDRGVLVLDGYSPFFSNPSVDALRDSRLVSYIPPRLSDYYNIPFTGRNGIIRAESDLVVFLAANRRQYPLVLDMPNLYDQTRYPYRFTQSLMALAARAAGDGVYALVLSADASAAGARSAAFSSVAALFPHYRFFITEDFITVIASRKPLAEAPLLAERISAVPVLGAGSPLFYSAEHFLSHIVAGVTLAGDSQRCPYPVPTAFFSNDPTGVRLKALYRTGEAVPVLAGTPLAAGMTREREIIAELKNAERMEAGREFDQEMALLFSLKRFTAYNEPFRKYLDFHLAAREKLYVGEAAKLELDKRWEDAAKVYRAILVINPRNFDANYRLGLVHLTLQEIDAAFERFTVALSIDPSNALVNYQIGLMAMVRGEYQKALQHYQRSMELKNQDAMAYFYMGFCYEKLNQPYQADQYYKQAHLKDPQNAEIKTALERIARMIAEQQMAWKTPDLKDQRELEQGENFPLPVSKLAETVRLEVEKAEKADQAAGVKTPTQ